MIKRLLMTALLTLSASVSFAEKNIRFTDWNDFKEYAITQKGLNVQYVGWSNSWEVFAFDGPIEYSIMLTSGTTADDDFLDNYRDSANGLVPTHVDPFAVSLYDFAGNGTSAVAAAGVITAIDYRLDDTLYLSGGEILVSSTAIFGDWLEAEIVDVDNVLGSGAGLVLKHYIKGWRVNPVSRYVSIVSNYAGKVIAGLYIRVKYHSTGADDVGVALNFHLHKKLN